MADFPGMTINGKFCATAREAAERAGVTPQAIYYRVKIGWRDGDRTGINSRPCDIRNIRFRNEEWADIPTAAKATGVSRQAVYQYCQRTGQIGKETT